MNRTEFEELEMQVQQSGLSLKSYLRQIGVSSINIKRPTAELSLDEQAPYGVSLLFPNGLRAHFGSGSEKLLMEVLNQSLQEGHV